MTQQTYRVVTIMKHGMDQMNERLDALFANSGTKREATQKNTPDFKMNIFPLKSLEEVKNLEDMLENNVTLDSLVSLIFSVLLLHLFVPLLSFFLLLL